MQHVRNEVADVVAREGLPARQQLVHHAAECPGIRAAVHALPRACSGDMYAAVPRITPVPARHVADGRGIGNSLAIRPDVHRLGQPEIQHLDLSFCRELDVRRLQVAVDDSLLMRVLQRFGNLSADHECFVDWERTFPDAVSQRRPFHELQHQAWVSSACSMP